MEQENFNYMIVDKIEEAGYLSAMKGLSLSYKIPFDNAVKVARKIYNKSNNENKFLEHMDIWCLVHAPRYWWQEADTYRTTTKQSESTMHTLIKEIKNLFPSGNINYSTDNSEINKFILDNFEPYSLNYFQWKDFVETILNNKSISIIKRKLPEGFLQTREWKLNYSNLRNIISGRKDHKLEHWKKFIDQIIEQVDFPEFLTDLIERKE